MYKLANLQTIVFLAYLNGVVRGRFEIRENILSITYVGYGSVVRESDLIFPGPPSSFPWRKQEREGHMRYGLRALGCEMNWKVVEECQLESIPVHKSQKAKIFGGKGETSNEGTSVSEEENFLLYFSLCLFVSLFSN